MYLRPTLCVLVLACGCTKSNPGHLGNAAGADLAAASSDLAGTDLLGTVDDGGALPDGPFSCTPGAFVACSGDDALYCSADGTGIGVPFNCGASGSSCIGSSAPGGIPGCGQCSAAVCSNSSATAASLSGCTAQHRLLPPTVCVTLSRSAGPFGQCAAAGDVCRQCAGATVCGDGTSYGSDANSAYVCTQGVLGAATKCAFGCDGPMGRCRDLVPANDAGSHLATGTTFTCLATTASTLAAVSGVNGDRLIIDTGTLGVAAQVITKNGTPITGVEWGMQYTPTNSGTKAIVAHIASFTLSGDAQVTVVGPSALILLVDGAVDIGDTALVSVAGHGAPPVTVQHFPGAGGPSTNGGGNTNGGATPGAGGAGHDTHGGMGGAAGATAGSNPGGGYGANGILEAGARGGRDGGGFPGGALQISACGNFSLAAGTLINASAGGGLGLMVSGGCGGGSGGTILLEAATFNVTGGAASTLAGRLVANGGGGGAGGNISTGNGNDWDPTTTPTTAAAGGLAGASGVGGGIGGTTTQPSAGGSGASIGGGGGGAAGRIFANRSPAATMPSFTPASNSSPTPTVGTAAAQ